MSYPVPQYSNRNSGLSSLVGQSMDSYIIERGRWLCYIRTDSRFPCACFDSATQGPSNDNCPICLGTGYKVTPERLRGFMSTPENISTLANSSLQIGDWGRVNQYPALLYLPRLTFPNILDLIVECEWSVPTEQVALYGAPTKIIKPWKISAVIPYIFNYSSQVEMFLCGLEQHDLKIDVLQGFLQRSGNKILPPQRQDLTYNQDRMETFVPEGGNTGSRYVQSDAPSNTRPGKRASGRPTSWPMKGL